MGMFTVAITPDGRRVQFKTGYDDLDEYHVGDVVPLKIPTCGELDPGARRIPFVYGSVPDGVYWGCYEDGVGLEALWVVVKDHKIHAVDPVVGNRPARDVARFYQLKPPPYRQLFTREAFRAERVRKKARAARRLAVKHKFDLDTKDMTVAETVAYAAAQYLRSRMSETGMMRKLFPTVTVKEP